MFQKATLHFQPKRKNSLLQFVLLELYYSTYFSFSKQFIRIQEYHLSVQINLTNNEIVPLSTINLATQK